jgi:hypothetical protein
LEDDLGLVTIETMNVIDGEIKEFFSIGPMEITEGHPPRKLGSRVATGLGYIFEMGRPMKGGQIPQQNLSSPDLSVLTIAGSVQGESDSRSIGPMLCQAAHQMGVVVLDSHGGDLLLLFGKFRAQVVWVKVVDQNFGKNIENTF